ncbi:hypothetical protein NQ318_008825 [Aromia moschata]|uniref:Uncharacterized protein n=1 Tax=Aromia moschata TaxID=1265417 RepID=A0AAV8ZDA3_9CUCU|nr:hypothetical protein NQ318_008825 [Aromia moschata]
MAAISTIYEVCILRNETGNVAPDIPTLRRRDLEDYYWREYTGEIPHDSVKGGTDVNNKTTYIGQVYIKQWGIIPVTIYPGRRTVVATIQGVHQTDQYIKILCSPVPTNFEWIPTTANNLHVQFMNGSRGGNGGTKRTRNQNEVRQVWEGNAQYFPDVVRNQETSVNSYEVLVYKPNDGVARECVAAQ